MGWVAIALSRDIPAAVTRSVVLDEIELVIWRGEDGAAHLWVDRCPHRGMRLSYGFVRGNTLNCLYHGWQYGSESSCVRIPAHPDLTVPETIKATALTVREAGGFVWALSGDEMELPAVPPAQPLVSLAVLAAPGAIRNRLGDAPVTRLETGEAVLHVAWHRVDDGKVMLHALMEPGPDYENAANWLRGLRSELEQDLAA
jgi:phenylpropionate dioxygenase-like ring-hydroxylating dioxygenase large terminal subunit